MGRENVLHQYNHGEVSVGAKHVRVDGIVPEKRVVCGRYNTSLGLYGIYCQGEAETNIAHTALDKLLYLT